VLKVKFQRLHSTVVNSVNTANIIDFLFQEGVIGGEDMRTLHEQRDPRQQCRNLLGLLHTSEHPQAFVQLYRAIRKEPYLQCLVGCIDEFSDESVISVLQERYLSDLTGKCEYSNVCNF